jgi:hypothetical protein
VGGRNSVPCPPFVRAVRIRLVSAVRAVDHVSQTPAVSGYVPLRGHSQARQLASPATALPTRPVAITPGRLADIDRGWRRGHSRLHRGHKSCTRCRPTVHPRITRRPRRLEASIEVGPARIIGTRRSVHLYASDRLRVVRRDERGCAAARAQVGGRLPSRLVDAAPGQRGRQGIPVHVPPVVNPFTQDPPSPLAQLFYLTLWSQRSMTQGCSTGCPTRAWLA